MGSVLFPPGAGRGEGNRQLKIGNNNAQGESLRSSRSTILIHFDSHLSCDKLGRDEYAAF